MTGTQSQIEWAVRIKTTIEEEFDRIMRALLHTSFHQEGRDHEDTLTILTILQQLRTDVLAREEAGYFIHDWQTLRDQVPVLLAKDPRYQVIRRERDARRIGLPHVV